VSPGLFLSRVAGVFFSWRDLHPREFFSERARWGLAMVRCFPPFSPRVDLLPNKKSHALVEFSFPLNGDLMTSNYVGSFFGKVFSFLLARRLQGHPLLTGIVSGGKQSSGGLGVLFLFCGAFSGKFPPLGWTYSFYRGFLWGIEGVRKEFLSPLKRGEGGNVYFFLIKKVPLEGELSRGRFSLNVWWMMDLPPHEIFSLFP